MWCKLLFRLLLVLIFFQRQCILRIEQYACSFGKKLGPLKSQLYFNQDAFLSISGWTWQAVFVIWCWDLLIMDFVYLRWNLKYVFSIIGLVLYDHFLMIRSSIISFMDYNNLKLWGFQSIWSSLPWILVYVMKHKI